MAVAGPMKRLRALPADPEPPAGVHLETDGGVTRLTIGADPQSWRRAALWWALALLAFGALAYRVEPRAGYVAAGMAGLALLAIFVFGLGRGKLAEQQGSAVCLNEERIWVERPPDASPEWVEAARTAFAGAPGPETGIESLPLDSMPLSVVRQVRVEIDAGARSRPRLVIEAEAARLEFAGAGGDRERLEWIRDYLRQRLAK